MRPEKIVLAFGICICICIFSVILFAGFLVGVSDKEIAYNKELTNYCKRNPNDGTWSINPEYPTNAPDGSEVDKFIWINCTKWNMEDTYAT